MMQSATGVCNMNLPRHSTMISAKGSDETESSRHGHGTYSREKSAKALMILKFEETMILRTSRHHFPPTYTESTTVQREKEN